MSEPRPRKIGWKALAALGLFFGAGFTAGFLTGFEYGFANRQPPNAPEALSADLTPPSAAPSPASPDLANTAAAENSAEDDEAETGIEGGEFSLTEHELGEDENGLFISGTVVNESQSAFDAVRVAFELCDANGAMYSTVSDRTNERMEPGDSWGFVVYLPYAEMKQFHSYRLQGIMGVRR